MIPLPRRRQRQPRQWRSWWIIPVYGLLLGVHVLADCLARVTNRGMSALDEYHDRACNDGREQAVRDRLDETFHND